MTNVNHRKVLSIDLCATPSRKMLCGAINLATHMRSFPTALTERSARYHAIMMEFSGWFGGNPCNKGGDNDLV